MIVINNDEPITNIQIPLAKPHWAIGYLNIGIHLELGIWLLVLDSACLRYQYPGHFGN